MSAAANIAGLMLPVVIGLGAGWAGAAFLVPTPSAPPEPPSMAEEVALDALASPVAIVPLDPIVTNLSDAGGAWVRAELSAVFVAEPTREAAEAVHADALAYLRSTPLSQIATPSGYLFLRSDLRHRAGALTDGAVTDVLVRTLIVE